MEDKDLPAFFFNEEITENVTKMGQDLVRKMQDRLDNYLTEDMKDKIEDYYGNLVDFEEFKRNDNLSFETNSIQGREDSIEFFQEMMNLGVVDILFAVDDDAIDTAFFMIDEKTDLAALMVHIHTQRPDEFTMQPDNKWFRLWWD